VVPLVVGASVVLQHRQASTAGIVVAVIVAVVPAILRAGGWLPIELAAPPTIAAVFWLLDHPAHADAAPLLLVALAADAGIVHPRTGVPVVLAAAAAPVALNLAGRFDSSLLWVAGIGFAYGAGALGRTLMRLVTELRDAQAGLAARAAADERQRIAREIHDVVAHSLAVTMLHMTGARLAVTAGEYDDAVDALTEAERVGRQSLAEVRRTVGLLAVPGDAVEPTAPAEPTAADIAELVDRWRHAGMAITWHPTGEPAALEPTAGLGLYRIAQESLANAAKHAPGTVVEVHFTVDDGSACLSVRNLLPTGASAEPSGGLGLRGMRERADLLGGRMRAGANGDSWVVEVDVPVGRA
jgi:signal transduction histidine kinase